MANANAYSLPVPNGTINCTVKRPTLGLVKNFRRSTREGLEATYAYNATLDELGKACTNAANGVDGADDEVARLSQKLTDLDTQSYANLTSRASMVLNPTGFTAAPGVAVDPNADAPAATLADVTWDDVETSEIQAINDVFQKSIGG